MSKKMTGVVFLLTILTSEAALGSRAAEGETELKQMKKELARELASGERKEGDIMEDFEIVMNRGVKLIEGRGDLIKELKKQKLNTNDKEIKIKALSLYKKLLMDSRG